MRVADVRTVVLGLCLTASACSSGSPSSMAPDLGESTSSDDGGLSNITLTTLDPTTGGVPPETDSGDTLGVDDSGTSGVTTGTTSDATTQTTESASSSSGDDDSSSSSSSSSGEEAPAVDSTTPFDLQSGVAPGSIVSVTFTEVMDPDTITSNVADTTCSGTLQISADDFATCLRVTAAPSSADDETFTVVPSDLLASSSTYQIRVLGSVTDAGGTPMGDDFVTATGFITQYFHAIAIDGANDFLVGETFATSTGTDHTGYVAWDASYLTIGLDSPDVGAGDAGVWFVAYIGGDDGTTDGVLYNTQQPALPFEAQYHVRWRADATFTGALEWDGASWIEPAWTINPGDVLHAGQFVELRVSMIDIGTPDYLRVHLGLLRETAFDEASWAAVPEASYADGYDPDYAQYFEFDLAGSTLPADYAPLP